MKQRTSWQQASASIVSIETSVTKVISARNFRAMSGLLSSLTNCLGCLLPCVFAILLMKNKKHKYIRQKCVLAKYIANSITIPQMARAVCDTVIRWPVLKAVVKLGERNCIGNSNPHSYR